MLIVSCLEEAHFRQGPVRISEQHLELRASRRVRSFSRGGEMTCRICSTYVQVIQRKEHRLGEVERRMVGRGNSYHHMSQVEGLIRQPFVLAAKENCYGPLRCKEEQVLGGCYRLDDSSFSRPPARGETGNAHTVGYCAFEIVEVLDGVDDLLCVMRNPDEAEGVVGNWAHEPQLVDAHVFHCANRRGNVDGIEGLVENDANCVQTTQMLLPGAPRHTEAHFAAPCVTRTRFIPLDYRPAGNEAVDDYNDCDDEQDMDQGAAHRHNESSQNPQDQQDKCDGPEH